MRRFSPEEIVEIWERLGNGHVPASCLKTSALQRGNV